MLGVDIGKILQQVRDNPTDASVKKVKVEISSVVRSYVAERQRKFLIDILLKLYDFDYSSCQRGITKCLVLNPKHARVSEKETERMLALIWDVICQYYGNEDFTQIFNVIATLALNEKFSNDSDLPF